MLVIPGPLILTQFKWWLPKHTVKAMLFSRTWTQSKNETAINVEAIDLPQNHNELRNQPMMLCKVPCNSSQFLHSWCNCFFRLLYTTLINQSLLKCHLRDISCYHSNSISCFKTSFIVPINSFKFPTHFYWIIIRKLRQKRIVILRT